MAQKKKKKRKLTPFGRFLKITYRTLVIVSALIVAGFLTWKALVRPPEIAQPPAPEVPVNRPVDDPDTPEDESQAEPEPGLARKELFYTFLLVAEDQVSGSTDTIIAASYDVVNQRVGLVSLPRDTLVDRRVGPYRYHRLNAAFGNAKAAGADPVGELRSAVSELLGIPIDFYVKVDIKSFVRIVDAVGGVDFEVPVKMDYDAPDQDLHIHYEPKMYYGLSGQQVLEIARCRKNTVWHSDGTYELYDAYPDAEIGRTRTQQALLKAIAKKVLSWGSMTKIGPFMDIVGESVKTDLTLDNLLYFATSALGVDLSDGVSTATFPGRGDVTAWGLEWLYQYDKPAALEIVNSTLNPYTTDVTDEMAKMLQVE